MSREARTGIMSQDPQNIPGQATASENPKPPTLVRQKSLLPLTTELRYQVWR